MRETWVQSLGWEDPLEKGKASTPVFWPREFHGLYSPWDHKESYMTERLSLHFTHSLWVKAVSTRMERRLNCFRGKVSGTDVNLSRKSMRALSHICLFTTPWTASCQAPQSIDFLFFFLSKNTGVGCHFLLQGVFPTQGSNVHLLASCSDRQILLPLSKQGNPEQEELAIISKAECSGAALCWEGGI